MTHTHTHTHFPFIKLILKQRYTFMSNISFKSLNETMKIIFKNMHRYSIQFSQHGLNIKNDYPSTNVLPNPNVTVLRQVKGLHALALTVYKPYQMVNCLVWKQEPCQRRGHNASFYKSFIGLQASHFFLWDTKKIFLCFY